MEMDLGGEVFLGHNPSQIGRTISGSSVEKRGEKASLQGWDGGRRWVRSFKRNYDPFGAKTGQ